MKLDVRFKVDRENALGIDRYSRVDWDSVVGDAIRTKLKMLRQTGPTSVPTVATVATVPAIRDPIPWREPPSLRALRPAKPKKPPREKPAAPSPEEILRRRAMLRETVGR